MSGRNSLKYMRTLNTKMKPPPKQKPIEINDEFLKQARPYQLMVAGVVLIAYPSIELYRRYILGGERKKQTGEILEDGTLRLFTPEEIELVDKSRWVVWLFGDK